MASELIVQTIQGPSSGANANKVLIPSGHTLEVDGITGLAGGNLMQVGVHDYTPANWSYSASTTYGTDLYTATFTLPVRSLVTFSCSGHVENDHASLNVILDLSVDNDITWNMVYPNYKGQWYYNATEANSGWAGFQLTKTKELSAGSHTVAVRGSTEGQIVTLQVNGSAIRITALGLI